MTNRVSNKQILEAIAGQTDAINALVGALTQTVAAPAPTPVVSDTETDAPKFKVSKSYLANRKVAAQAHANKVGGEIVLYARQNLAGRVVLAYAQATRHADVSIKDKGYLGKVDSFQPE
jgi:hypothetical protein